MAQQLAKVRRTNAKELTQEESGVCFPTLDADAALDRASPFKFGGADAVCDALVKLSVSGGDAKLAAGPEAGVDVAPVVAAVDCETTATRLGDPVGALRVPVALDDGADEHARTDDEAEDKDAGDDERETAARNDSGVRLLECATETVVDMYAFSTPAQLQEKRLATRFADLKMCIANVLDIRGECPLLRENATEQYFFYAGDNELVRVTKLELYIIVDAAEFAGWAVKTTKGRVTDTWTISIPDDASKWSIDDLVPSGKTGLEDTADLCGFVSPKLIQFTRLQRALRRLKEDVLAVLEATGICDLHDEETHYFMQGLRKVPLTPLEHRIIIESADRCGWKLNRTNDRKTRRWRILFPPTDEPCPRRVPTKAMRVQSTGSHTPDS